MFKFNKKSLLDFKHKNNTSSLTSNSKGKDNKLKIVNNFENELK
jgi:hypothetical protein